MNLVLSDPDLIKLIFSQLPLHDTLQCFLVSNCFLEIATVSFNTRLENLFAQFIQPNSLALYKTIQWHFSVREDGLAITELCNYFGWERVLEHLILLELSLAEDKNLLFRNDSPILFLWRRLNSEKEENLVKETAENFLSLNFTFQEKKEKVKGEDKISNLINSNPLLIDLLTDFNKQSFISKISQNQKIFLRTIKKIILRELPLLDQNLFCSTFLFTRWIVPVIINFEFDTEKKERILLGRQIQWIIGNGGHVLIENIVHNILKEDTKENQKKSQKNIEKIEQKNDLIYPKKKILFFLEAFYGNFKTMVKAKNKDMAILAPNLKIEEINSLLSVRQV